MMVYTPTCNVVELRENAPFIVLDAKKPLTQQMVKQMEANGYKVLCINLNDLAHEKVETFTPNWEKIHTELGE